MPGVIILALGGMLISGSALPQPTHRAVSIGDINANPSAFHGELVEVRGIAKRQNDRFVLTNTDGTLTLLAAGPFAEGDVQVRGKVFDIGRLRRDDPQLEALNVRIAAENAYGNRWPSRGEEIALAVTSITRQSSEIVGVAITPVPPLPLDVDFSVPIQGESDVRLGTLIRLQFSRDVDVASLKDRIRITYSQVDSVERGEAQPPGVLFTYKYDAGMRTLEIRPTQALERFRQVRVELLEGIAGTDSSILRPWVLTFSTGGS